MDQNQWYHFGVGAPPILEPIFSWGLNRMFTGGYDLDFDPWPFLVFHGWEVSLSQVRLEKEATSSLRNTRSTRMVCPKGLATWQNDPKGLTPLRTTVQNAECPPTPFVVWVLTGNQKDNHMIFYFLGSPKTRHTHVPDVDYSILHFVGVRRS